VAQYPVYALKSILQISEEKIALRGEEFCGGPAADKYLHCKFKSSCHHQTWSALAR
jgi:hypothetical protein